MSITSVKSGLTGISLALDNNYMEPIATTLVGAGGTTVIEFKDIPQGYKHLQIRGIGKTTRSGANNYVSDISMIFNSDSSNNYSRHGMYVFGPTYAYSVTDANIVGIQSISADGDGAIPNVFGAFIIDILDYNNINKFKTVKGIGGTLTTPSYSDILGFNSANWRSYNPIENIKITAAFTFKQHSRFSLYGIKG